MGSIDRGPAAESAIFAHAPRDEITAIQISSSFLFDQTLFAIVRGNLVRSLDAGLTWWRVTKGLPREALERIFLSPHFSSDGRAFVSSVESGFYLSVDCGVSWSRHAEESAAALADLSFSPGFAHDGRVAAADRMGCLLLSMDSGGSWRRVPLPDARATCAVLTEITLLVGTDDGRLLVLDRDGTALSSAPVGGAPIACMTVTENGLVAVGTSGHGVVLCFVSAVGAVSPLRRGLDRN